VEMPMLWSIMPVRGLRTGSTPAVDAMFLSLVAVCDNRPQARGNQNP
jgi:hypothetical protein